MIPHREKGWGGGRGVEITALLGSYEGIGAAYG